MNKNTQRTMYEVYFDVTYAERFEKAIQTQLNTTETVYHINKEDKNACMCKLIKIGNRNFGYFTTRSEYLKLLAAKVAQ